MWSTAIRKEEGKIFTRLHVIFTLFLLHSHKSEYHRTYWRKERQGRDINSLIMFDISFDIKVILRFVWNFYLLIRNLLGQYLLVSYTTPSEHDPHHLSICGSSSRSFEKFPPSIWLCDLQMTHKLKLYVPFDYQKMFLKVRYFLIFHIP